jgi:hypothetical protein
LPTLKSVGKGMLWYSGYAYGMVLPGELACEINEDKDEFLEKDSNICLLLVQIIIWLGMA